MTARTLFEKIWDSHIVRPQTPETPAVLYIDLHLVHEVTSPQAFTELRERGLTVRRPDRTLATMDHSTPTTPRAPRTNATTPATIAVELLVPSPVAYLPNAAVETTSTAGAAASCRTVILACPAASFETSFTYGVRVGFPSAVRCAAARPRR